MILQNMANAGIGMGEIVFIIIIAAILIFGAKKIPELARTLGRAKGEFEKGKLESDKELKDIEKKGLKEKKEPKEKKS
ncbi:MAG: twin-arginine translocase TatA/TatE family subunit [Nitrososphaerales archaeon]